MVFFSITDTKDNIKYLFEEHEKMAKIPIDNLMFYTEKGYLVFEDNTKFYMISNLIIDKLKNKSIKHLNTNRLEKVFNNRYLGIQRNTYLRLEMTMVNFGTDEYFLCLDSNDTLVSICTREKELFVTRTPKEVLIAINKIYNGGQEL